MVGFVDEDGNRVYITCVAAIERCPKAHCEDPSCSCRRDRANGRWYVTCGLTRRVWTITGRMAKRLVKQIAEASGDGWKAGAL